MITKTSQFVDTERQQNQNQQNQKLVHREDDKIDSNLGRLTEKKKGEDSNCRLGMKLGTQLYQHYKNKSYCTGILQLYANKVDNWEEMNKNLERHKLPKMIKEEMKYMNRPIKMKISNYLLKSIPQK